MRNANVRLHVEQPLEPGQAVALGRGQSNYLFGVMRLGVGDALLLFNGRDGEWRAVVSDASRRGGALKVAERTAPQGSLPDLWLLFAPVKKVRTDFIVEKATEMGAARILPVRTERTNAGRVRVDRLRSLAVEAAEQCGGTCVPEVGELRDLDALLADWPQERRLMFCDESLAGRASGLDGAPPQIPWAVLIGPEGGFSEAERARLGRMEQSHPVSLGPRVLRSDTAAVAALTLWQARLGDWSRAACA